MRIPALSDGVSIEQIELKFRSLGGLLRFGERLVERKPGACVPGSGVTARGSSNRVHGGLGDHSGQPSRLIVT